MDWTWITTSWDAALMSVVSAVGVYIAVIVFTRVAGLRSFSKMSSFDFAMTVAVGSVIATTVLTKDPPLLLAVVALGALYALQIGVAELRVRFDAVSTAVDNHPVLLMEEGRLIDEALKSEEITRADLIAKLREANVLQLERVRAVVLETTGDLSVIHGDPDVELSEELLENVRRY